MKICHECNENLRCVYTGCTVYLAHTGDCHQADLFACFPCNLFRVFGLNMIPVKMWDSEKKPVTPQPDVIVAGKVIVIPYGDDSVFATVEGEVIPLPSALKYMIEKCHHDMEIAAYLSNAPRLAKASRWMKK